MNEKRAKFTLVDNTKDYTDYRAVLAKEKSELVVKFKNGSYGIIEGTTNVYPKNLEETLYLFGEKGTVKAGGTSVNKIKAWKFADGKDEEEKIIDEFHENPPNIYGFGHMPLYADMIDAIQKSLNPM